MREICTSGSVGGEGGNILAYPAPPGRSRPSATGYGRTPNNRWPRHKLDRVRRAHAVGAV